MKCLNEKCPNEFVKLKFAGKGMYVKFTFASENDNKHHQLTMFRDEVESIVPGVWDMDDTLLNKAILSIDEIRIVKDARNIVTDITIV